MPFSESIDNSILNHFFKVATWTAPTDVYAGLSTNTPSKTGTGVSEPQETSYARVQLTAAGMSGASGSFITSTATFTFATATTNWANGVTLTTLVLFSALTAGTFLGYKALAVGKPVMTNDIPIFNAGDIDITMGGT